MIKKFVMLGVLMIAVVLGSQAFAQENDSNSNTNSNTNSGWSGSSGSDSNSNANTNANTNSGAYTGSGTSSGTTSGRYRSMKGTIQSIDPTAKTITISLDSSAMGSGSGSTSSGSSTTTGQTMTLTFNSSTSFMRNKTSIQSSGLKVGDHVKVETDSTNTVVRLLVLEKTSGSTSDED